MFGFGLYELLVFVLPIVASVWAGVTTIKATKAWVGIRAAIIGALTALLGLYLKDRFAGAAAWSEVHPALTLLALLANAELITGLAVVAVSVLSVSRLSKGQEPGGNAPSARFCTQCGSRLEAGRRFCPSCGLAAE